MKKLIVLLLLLLAGVARAEDPGPAVLTVLDMANGRLVGNYLLDKVGRREMLKHENPVLRKLAQRGALGLHLSSDGLGELPTGERLKIQVGRELLDEGDGPLVGVDAQKRVRLLVPKTHMIGAGASLYVSDPVVSIAYPYLLISDSTGVVAVDLRTNKSLWRGDWQLGYSRWGWGSWYHDGALYAQTRKGFARVDTTTGNILWTYPEIGEVGAVHPGAPGQIVLASIYRSKAMDEQLLESATARFKKAPEGTWIVPWGTRFYGSSDGKFLWEYQNGRWVYLGDEAAKSLPAPLRQQLTEPDYDTLW